MTTDTERLDFIERHKLYALPNDFGEWQVWEAVPHYYSDGCVTQNSFLPSMRDAIDHAIAYYLGGENQQGAADDTRPEWVGVTCSYYGGMTHDFRVMPAAEPAESIYPDANLPHGLTHR